MPNSLLEGLMGGVQMARQANMDRMQQERFQLENRLANRRADLYERQLTAQNRNLDFQEQQARAQAEQERNQQRNRGQGELFQQGVVGGYWDWERPPSTQDLMANPENASAFLNDLNRSGISERLAGFSITGIQPDESGNYIVSGFDREGNRIQEAVDPEYLQGHINQAFSFGRQAGFGRGAIDAATGLSEAMGRGQRPVTEDRMMGALQQAGFRPSQELLAAEPQQPQVEQPRQERQATAFGELTPGQEQRGQQIQEITGSRPDQIQRSDTQGLGSGYTDLFGQEALETEYEPGSTVPVEQERERRQQIVREMPSSTESSESGTVRLPTTNRKLAKEDPEAAVQQMGEPTPEQIKRAHEIIRGEDRAREQTRIRAGLTARAAGLLSHEEYQNYVMHGYATKAGVDIANAEAQEYRAQQESMINQRRELMQLQRDQLNLESDQFEFGRRVQDYQQSVASSYAQATIPGYTRMDEDLRNRIDHQVTGELLNGQDTLQAMGMDIDVFDPRHFNHVRRATELQRRYSGQRNFMDRLMRRPDVSVGDFAALYLAEQSGLSADRQREGLGALASSALFIGSAGISDFRTKDEIRPLLEGAVRLEENNGIPAYVSVAAYAKMRETNPNLSIQEFLRDGERNVLELIQQNQLQ